MPTLPIQPPHRAVGQPELIEWLRLAVRVARKQNEPLGHTLLVGPPGLGKTTIARAAAAELGTRLHSSSGPLLKDPAVLVRLLAGLDTRDVLFIDEVHALRPSVAETLYQALSDCRLSLLLTCGAEARTLTLRLEPFTLIGATTDEGLLPDAFLNRFENRERLSFYKPSELTEIIVCGAAELGIEIDEDAARKLAKVSRETPREALRLLGQARIEAVGADISRIDVDLVTRTLERLRIDSTGLGPVDREYLQAVGALGPIGIGRLSAMLAVPVRTLEREHEPYLFRLGLATTTPHGRIALRRS